MERLDQRAVEKVSGPAWKPLKEAFLEISRLLLGVSQSAKSSLTTIYVKYTIDIHDKESVYAVVWLKTSKSIVVGLSLPEGHKSPRLGPAPKGMVYKGLTKYFEVGPASDVPRELSEWARIAFQKAKAQEG